MTRFCRIHITQKKSEPAGKGLFGDARHEFLPTLLEDDEEETMLTADDISELQADMDAWNNQAKSD